MPTPHHQSLELLLLNKSRDHAQQPNLKTDLFQQYEACLSYLKTSIYPYVDAGLAALSKENGIFTLHGPDHFDEVVKYAGLLLDAGSASVDLNAYELFILLVAIRIHDAGNMFGRENHERRTYEILSQMGTGVFPDQFEIRQIASIAEAHGGVTGSGSKDKIGELPPTASYGSANFRPRLLAAICRFADEICESRTRAAECLLRAGSLPPENEVFHKYATAIKAVVPEPGQHRVRIAYDFFVEDAMKKWGKGRSNGTVETVYLIDEIFGRLEKMFRELEYCRRYMRGVCDIEHVNATIEIHKTPTSEFWSPQDSVVKRYDIRSEPEGYPIHGVRLSDVLHVTGKSLVKELREKRARK